MSIKQKTEIEIPIKCAQCGKTLAYRTTNLRIGEGHISVKCRNCKTLKVICSPTKQHNTA